MFILIKINYLFIIFYCLLSLNSSLSFGQENSDKLFEQVFGHQKESQKIKLDATVGDLYLGEVEVTIVNEKIQSLNSGDLDKILDGKIREEKKASYTFRKNDITPSALPFKITYFPKELRVALEISKNDLKPLDANVFDDIIPYYSRKAVGPAPFSFGINYKLEDTQVKNINQSHVFQAQTDSFLNIKNVAIENQLNYLATQGETTWYRQNTKLTYDRSNKMQRMEMGDVNYPIIGYQQSRALGGLSIYRDFSLNPYQQTGPSSAFEYEVESRSLVRTYVNNIILKTEYMNPGRYSVNDIPLVNGLNKIIVELTDDLGKKKVYIFNEAGSLDLLSPGLSRYSLATGLPSTEEATTKKYNHTEGAFYSSFYQYGINKTWSLGGYLQGNKNFELFGMNNIVATNHGNLAFDLAGSSNPIHTGEVLQATYQLNLFGAYWYDSNTLTTKVEYRTPWFNESGEDFQNRFDISTNISYSVPLFEKFNLAIGANYQNPKIAENAKYGLDTSLTAKIFNSSSLTCFLARNRDENKLWSNQIYFFLNITFGESSTFASAFYEEQSKTKRLTIVHDNGKQLNDLKVSSSFDDNPNTRNGTLDLQYNTTLADLGAREEIITNKGLSTGTRTSFRLMSAVAFVNNGADSAFSISRPIANSFVIFKPAPDWEGQHFSVQSNNNEADASTGLFGESLISGLTPYQYRRLQLDPSLLEPGYILGQESFAVYPHYRSANLFVVGKSGLVVIRGILVDKNKNPLPLKVGTWKGKSGKTIPFFTGREGTFYIEGVEAKSGQIQIDDELYNPLDVNIESNQKGIINIGTIELPAKENRL